MSFVACALTVASWRLMICDEQQLSWPAVTCIACDQLLPLTCHSPSFISYKSRMSLLFLQEDFKKREAELLTKSEASWKQYQQQRGHAPLYKLMEEDYDKRIAAEEAAKKEWYKEEVGKNKMATVSQLVSGEVHIKPPSDTVTRQEFFTR